MLDKIKEVMIAIIPINILVIFIDLFILSLPRVSLLIFFASSLLLIVGLALFMLGVDISASQMGRMLGQGLTRLKRKHHLFLATAGVGFIISIAEPSLTILAHQIERGSFQAISQLSVIIIVSLGIAVFMALGIFRIVFRWNLRIIMMLGYLLVFLLSFFIDDTIFAFAFDASGATTGVMTVPFILAISQGISSMTDNPTDDNHFGLVGITSIGPILAVIILGLLTPQLNIDITDIEAAGINPSENFISFFLTQAFQSIKQVIFGLGPLLLIFALYHYLIEKQSQRMIRDSLLGFLYLAVGLTLFLLGVSTGFMPLGRILGENLYMQVPTIWLMLIGFILGVVAILAEPAIYILIDQMEMVTGGAVAKLPILMTLSISIGLAIVLSIAKILVPNLNLWGILFIGFALILILANKVSPLFVGLALDSGGTASGPMTGTFIFAFIQGIAQAHPHAEPLRDGFGMIGIVAMTPILCVQILGLIYQKQQDQAED